MEDIQLMINKQIHLIHEDEDKFIFETIRTYTDGILVDKGIFKIPKKLLERALICFKYDHPEEFRYLLKETENKEE